MCDALLRLMKPEMDATIEVAVAEKEAETKFNDVESVIRKYGESLAEACEMMKISGEDYMKIKEKRNLSRLCK